MNSFFGVGQDANSLPLNASNIITGKTALLAYVSGLTGGCSLVSHTGAWADNGRLITEQGYTLVVLTVTADIAQGIAAFIKSTFNQKSVLVVQSEVSSVFI